GPGLLESSIPKLGPDNRVLQICELHHDSEADHTFNNWFDKSKGMFRKDLTDITEEERTRSLLRRPGIAELKKSERYISLKGWMISNPRK
ncbi:unnamed protein product, partial [Hymenolepis diminuta]